MRYITHGTERSIDFQYYLESVYSQPKYKRKMDNRLFLKDFRQPKAKRDGRYAYDDTTYKVEGKMKELARS